MINDQNSRISMEMQSIPLDSSIHFIESITNTPEGELKQILQKVTGDYSTIFDMNFDPNRYDNYVLIVRFRWKFIDRQQGVYLKEGHWVYSGPSLA